MKKASILIAIMLLNAMAIAQIQQGYVKTKGRMVNGQLVHGQGLKGATVSIKGRTTVLVNADDGAFSFPVPETQFRLDSVRKKGYQLVDVEACPRMYKYSSNPLYIVMETPDQQLQDELDAQRKIRRTLERQLREREDEIEALKEQQKISEEEYRQALQKLYEDTDQNEQLVKDMVERYSKIDYDQLNNFDLQISEFILNGELTKADSMLRTKGDINERKRQYQKHKAINAKEREDLSQRQEQLEQSEILAQKELEDLANDCYRKFEIFKLQHLNDSAVHYLEVRANLDTLNVTWQYETAYYLKSNIGDYAKAIAYCKHIVNQDISKNCSKYVNQDEYQIALNYIRILILYDRLIETTRLERVHGYYRIGFELYNNGNYQLALECFENALLILSEFPSENINQQHHNDIAFIYINIGNIQIIQENYFKSQEYFKKALFAFNQLKENCIDSTKDKLTKPDTHHNVDYYIIILKEKINEIESATNKTNIQPILLPYDDNTGRYLEELDAYYEASCYDKYLESLGNGLSVEDKNKLKKYYNSPHFSL